METRLRINRTERITASVNVPIHAYFVAANVVGCSLRIANAGLRFVHKGLPEIICFVHVQRNGADP
jgi:hypothetical protein